ncbi:MAG: hypothetical protein WCF46_11045 [Nitrososphaeraceae archaeon]
MQVSLMIKLIGSCVFLVTGISFTFFSQPEVLSTSSPGSVGFSSSSSYETFDGINLGLSFQYPANWIMFEAGFDPVFMKDFEGVVSFDIVNDDDHLKQGNGGILVGDSGLVNPNLSIVSLKSPYHNLTLKEYAKIRTYDFRQLFSDYYLHMTENSQSNESIDGYPYWVLDYSFRIDDKTNRYGMSILLIRGEKVYEISYIADSYEEFIRNLAEVRKMIKTMYFVDSTNQ